MTEVKSATMYAVKSGGISQQIISLDSRNTFLSKFNENGWPTSKNEEWRFTSLNGFRNLIPSDSDSTSKVSNLLQSKLLPCFTACNHIVLHNGIWDKENSKILDTSLMISSLSDDSLIHQNWFTKNFNHLIESHQDPVIWLNRAVAQNGICIYVEDNVILEFPILVTSTNESIESINHSRYFIHIGHSASAEIYWEDLIQNNAHINDVIECKVEAYAELNFNGITFGQQGSELIQTIELHQGEKSIAKMVSLNINGQLTRKNWHLRMLGKNAYNEVSGIYLAALNQLSDNHILIDHRVENCESNQLFKGIITENGKGVFNGKIYVREGAQKTLAYQSNKNLLLSDNAEVNTKPQLEILADDVKCSHGATVGQLDQDALFYLKARGIPEDKARHILTQAFCSDVVSKISNEAVRELMAEEIINVLNIGM